MQICADNRIKEGKGINCILILILVNYWLGIAETMECNVQMFL